MGIRDHQLNTYMMLGIPCHSKNSLLEQTDRGASKGEIIAKKLALGSLLERAG